MLCGNLELSQELKKELEEVRLQEISFHASTRATDVVCIWYSIEKLAWRKDSISRERQLDVRAENKLPDFLDWEFEMMSFLVHVPYHNVGNMKGKVMGQMTGWYILLISTQQKTSPVTEQTKQSELSNAFQWTWEVSWQATCCGFLIHKIPSLPNRIVMKM